MIDAQRSQVYAAETAVVGMVDRGFAVPFHGTTLNPEPDRKFGQVHDIVRYLDWLRSTDFGCADVPAPTVRVRRGGAKATWEAPGVLAVPDATWARRELVVLHEYAHHVVWHRSGLRDNTHGPPFCRMFADLVRQAVGPSTGLILTDAFYRSGLFEA